MRALIVDDSRAMRAILGMIMKEVGFEVTEASHGKEGVLRLQEDGAPDLILVDWNMPEMNGLEFVRWVRAQRDYDGVRVMMVTTETEIAQVRRALEAGADEYVMKPFTKDVLRDKLSILGLPGPKGGDAQDSRAHRR